MARIRRGVIAATLSAFVLAWGVIAYDGSMGKTTTASTTSSSAAATPDSSSSTDNNSAAPLTTSQS